MIGLEKYEMCQVLKRTAVTQFEESGYVQATAEQRGNCTVVAPLVSHVHRREVAPDGPL